MLDLLQWPAMVITVAAAWLVASRSPGKRKVGFWCFLASNVAWTVWGVHAHAWALIVLQVALAALNIRGVHKNVQAVDECKLDADPATPARATASSARLRSA